MLNKQRRWWSKFINYFFYKLQPSTIFHLQIIPRKHIQLIFGTHSHDCFFKLVFLIPIIVNEISSFNNSNAFTESKTLFFSTPYAPNLRMKMSHWSQIKLKFKFFRWILVLIALCIILQTEVGVLGKLIPIGAPWPQWGNQTPNLIPDPWLTPSKNPSGLFL